MKYDSAQRVLMERSILRGGGSCFLNTVPVEIVETILRFVARPKDILNFALASRACYSTALAVLYRSVDWVVGDAYPDSREAAKRSVAFLLAHSDILSGTHALRVSEKKLGTDSDTKIYLSLSLNEFPAQPVHKPMRENPATMDYALKAIRCYSQTFLATTTVLSVLGRFSGLTDLTLRSITLPRNFYQSIHSLSKLHLRRITLRYCRLTTRYPAGYDPSELQLIELTIFNVCAGVPKLKALLKLARSPTLCVLRVDRSIQCAIRSLVANGIPPSIHSLEVDWRGWSLRESRQACGLLFFFLNSCKFVRHVELTDMGKLESLNSFGPWRLKDNALPSLTSIAVPVMYLGLLLTGRATIDSVTITDVTREVNMVNPMLKFLTVDEIGGVLTTLQNASASLQSLKFNLHTFDKELLYMLARHQPNLKELHIAFQYGEIDDSFYMTLGSLIEFPSLERLHLYRFGNNMTACGDNRFIDQKEYMVIWQLYMPNLCEVALSPDVIWKRAPALPASDGRRSKGTWSRCAVEPMDGVEGLLMVPCPKEARQYEALIRHRQIRSHQGLQEFTWTHDVIPQTNTFENNTGEEEDFH